LAPPLRPLIPLFLSLDQTVNLKQSLQPLDRTAIALMALLTIMIGIMVWNGDRSGPRVRDFSWQNTQVGSEDTSFTLTFSRPMDKASVESSLQIDPLLPGKFSWAGRRMAYTLTTPAFYGTAYKVQLQGAKDRFSQGPGNGKGNSIEPFVGQFRTRDRAFAYVGVEGEEKGRLVMYNLTQQQKSILTPPDMVVTDFEPYPDGEKILFSASEWLNQKPGVFEQQIYTVTTGMNIQSPGKAETKSQPAKKIDRILDAKEYQNMKFDLSTDGQTIIVQRVNRRNPAEFGLWLVQPGKPAQPLENQPGGDFLITPDSAAVASAQGQGLAILPLTPKGKPLDFMPQFGKVLSFSKDGTAGAMVKFNADYTRSLFLVTNSGVQKELLKTTGSIIDAKFDPLSNTLYCLLTQLQKGENYQEQPYLASIDLKTAKVTPLLTLPNQRDIHISLAPDGVALLFDQIVTAQKLPKAGNLTTNDGQTISSAYLWLFPLPFSTSPSTTQIQPEKLPLPGFNPRWMP